MITIKADEQQEKLSILEKEIVLTGPPNNLQGSIHFANRQSEMLRVKFLALSGTDDKEPGGASMRSSFRLQPGEEALKPVKHQMPATTPPGTYEKHIRTGKSRHVVKLIVQPTINIAVHPQHFTFQGSEPGTRHTATIALRNLGNMPFRIPEPKHASMLDMDLLCRAFGMGFREAPDSGVNETLDKVAQNIKANMVDWAAMKIREAGQIVEPGGSAILHVDTLIPKNADPGRDYGGNFRFWDKDISIAVKSHLQSSKEKNRGRK